MSYVCSKHLHYLWEIITDLGFVFMAVVLHSETVGGAESHKTLIST